MTAPTATQVLIATQDPSTNLNQRFFRPLGFLRTLTKGLIDYLKVYTFLLLKAHANNIHSPNRRYYEGLEQYDRDHLVQYPDNDKDQM